MFSFPSVFENHLSHLCRYILDPHLYSRGIYHLLLTVRFFKFSCSMYVFFSICIQKSPSYLHKYILDLYMYSRGREGTEEDLFVLHKEDEKLF